MNFFHSAWIKGMGKVGKWTKPRSWASILLGGLFLAGISPLAINLSHTPVPITLHVFGIFLLILLLGKRSALSVLVYLFLVTCGLPILSGGQADAAWFLKPKAGYLIGFLCAAYLAGWLLERRQSSSWGWAVLSLSTGLACILVIGSSWLGYFIGFDQAFAKGVQPFLLGGFVKMLMALLSASGIKWVKKSLRARSQAV